MTQTPAVTIVPKAKTAIGLKFGTIWHHILIEICCNVPQVNHTLHIEQERNINPPEIFWGSQPRDGNKKGCYNYHPQAIFVTQPKRFSINLNIP